MKTIEDYANEHVEAVKSCNSEPTWGLIQTAVCYGFGLARQLREGTIIPGNLIVKNGGVVHLDRQPEYNQVDVRREGAADVIVDGGELRIPGQVRLGYDAIIMDDQSRIYFDEL